jgi:hypothetical protein
MITPANHLFRPSVARVVRLDSFVPVARGSTAVAPPPSSWPAKDPGDVLDYVLDIAPAISGNEGDTISALDVALSPDNPGDISVQSTATDGSRVVLWLLGGQAGTVYTITFNIVMTSGRVLQRSVLLPVLSLATPIYPENSLVISGGSALVDQNGNPVLSSV